jgi:hypothetical protein
MKIDLGILINSHILAPVLTKKMDLEYLYLQKIQSVLTPTGYKTLRSPMLAGLYRILTCP